MIWPVALLNIIQMIMNFILNLTRNDWNTRGQINTCNRICGSIHRQDQ
jgi:hypothetical protein